MRIVFLLIPLLLIFCNCNRSVNTDSKITKPAFYIDDAFMQLNIGSISNARKSLLLKNKRIDNIDDEYYMTIDVDSTSNSITVQSCYINSSSMPCENYSIKSYTVDSSKAIIVYSKSQNSYADNLQMNLEFYQYDIVEKSLSRDTTDRAAFHIELKDFFIDNAPDSIVNKYIDNVNPVYSIRDSSIFCSITDQGYENTLKDKTCLKGNVIEITWTGKNFEIKKIYKEQ